MFWVECGQCEFKGSLDDILYEVFVDENYPYDERLTFQNVIFRCPLCKYKEEIDGTV